MHDGGLMGCQATCERLYSAGLLTSQLDAKDAEGRAIYEREPLYPLSPMVHQEWPGFEPQTYRLGAQYHTLTTRRLITDIIITIVCVSIIDVCIVIHYYLVFSIKKYLESESNSAFQ